MAAARVPGLAKSSARLESGGVAEVDGVVAVTPPGGRDLSALPVWE